MKFSGKNEKLIYIEEYSLFDWNSHYVEILSQPIESVLSSF